MKLYCEGHVADSLKELAEKFGYAIELTRDEEHDCIRARIKLPSYFVNDYYDVKRYFSTRLPYEDIIDDLGRTLTLLLVKNHGDIYRMERYLWSPRRW